jgi:hypothetical protein
MKHERFSSWLINIYQTQDKEISCSECFNLVSKYVELEIENGDPQVKMPQVLQHLSQCKACRDEYETLRDLRNLEKGGNPPSIDDLKDLI